MAVVLLVMQMVPIGFGQSKGATMGQMGADSRLETYVEQVSELSARARANVYFANPQAIFNGVQVGFVNTGTGNLTFLRRDMVSSGWIPVAFARVYDSSSNGSSDFGTGWTLSAAETISVLNHVALLSSSSGSVMEFVETSAGKFVLKQDRPSDYSELIKDASDVLRADLRTGMRKEFSRIGNLYRLTRVVDSHGHELHLAYSDGRLVKMENEHHSVSIERNKRGRITKVQDDRGRTVKYQYDEKERLIEVDDLGSFPWKYSYAEDGRLISAMDPLQHLTFAVDYDGRGRVRRVRTPSGMVRYDYDLEDRRTRVIDRKELVSRYFQNEQGITTRVVNALGQETSIALDDALNVVSLSRDGALQETMKYDDRHRLISRTTFSDTGPLLHEYSYDSATGMLNAIDAGSKHNAFGYNSAGDLTSAVLGDGLHRYEYSPAGDLSMFSAGKIQIGLSWDADGNISLMKEGADRVTHLSYQGGGELAQAEFSDGRQGAYEYAPSGLRTKSAYRDGRRVEYSYDPAGNLIGTKVFDAAGQQINGQKLEMDDSYRLARWVLFDGTTHSFQYDANGNLTEWKQGKSVTRFEYDALDRLVAVVTPERERLTYTYKPGERSLIEQYEHAGLLVADLRDSGLTFASQSQVISTRSLTSGFGAVRFSETLGTFQLANPEGTEIVTPESAVEQPLKKMRLVSDGTPLRSRQPEFSRPFNTMFMPAEYASINCCPLCTDRGCPGGCDNGSAPSLDGISPSAGFLGDNTIPVTLTGAFNGVPPQPKVSAGTGITISAIVESPTNDSISANFSIATTAPVGKHSVTVGDSGGQSNALDFTVLPSITSIDPPMGLVGTGILVTISGAGFATGASVNAGANIAVSNISVSSSTQITATFTPANAASAGGNQTVTVTVNGLTSSSQTFFVQIPTSLSVISIPVITDGSPGGCTAATDFGISIDVKYQVLDQESPPQAIQSTNMTPFEDDTFPGNIQRSNNTCPSSVPDCTVNTASDGSYHDAPVGACNSVALSNYTETQIISILVGSAKYQVRNHSLTINSSQSGHGTISDGIDINVTR